MSSSLIKILKNDIAPLLNQFDTVSEIAHIHLAPKVQQQRAASTSSFIDVVDDTYIFKSIY
jgi:hypothetical protein